jgi:hypothetical protein
MTLALHSSRVLALLSLVLCTTGSVVHAQATMRTEMGSRDVHEVARVIASAGIAGRFGEPVCEGTHAMEVHAGAQFAGPLLERASLSDAPLVLDTGGLLAPHGVARFAARDLPDSLVHLAQSLGYDALALGEDDLSAPRARTLEVARRLQAQRLPYIATNLHCEAGAEALCEAVIDESDAPWLVEVGTERAAILSLLGPDVLQRIAPDRAAGLAITEIDIALVSAVRNARTRGATLVVAVIDSTSAEAFAMAREMPEDARPDLVLLAHEGNDMLFARPASVRPALAAPPPGGGVEIRVGRSAAMHDGFEMLAVPLEHAPEPAAPVQAFVNEVGTPYCAAYGRPLAGGHLGRALDVEEVTELAAGIVREFASADVAFLNVGAVDSSFHPSSATQLTASDLYIAIEYDEPIVVADVPGSWLDEALTQASAHDVVAPGLSRDGEALRVRGRPPVDDVTYRVATIRFLGQSGDGALPALPSGTSWRTLEHVEAGEVRYHSLRDVVTQALEPADPRDPRDARAAPNDALEWVVRGSLDGDFSGSSVSNAAAYDAAALAVDTTIAMGLDGTVRLDATAPTYTWETTLGATYRTQWSPSLEPDTAGAFIEANDRIQFRSMASYRGFRGTPSDVWVPDAYIEAFVESEFTRPDTREWHWLLMRPTLGARFPLSSEFEVKLQLGLQAQPLAPAAEAEAGAGASILLRPWSILEADDRSLTLEGNADFFCVDLFDQNRWQLRSQLDLALDLVGPLELTFGATLYAQQEGDQATALAFSATAGFRVGAVTRTISQ